jgi:hypothetical protein
MTQCHKQSEYDINPTKTMGRKLRIRAARVCRPLPLIFPEIPPYQEQEQRAKNVKPLFYGQRPSRGNENA